MILRDKVKNLRGPNLKARLAYSFHERRLRIEKRLFRSRYRKYERGIEVRPHWVSPELIQFATQDEFWIGEYRNSDQGGDWDRLDSRFEDLDLFHAFIAVKKQGLDWAETPFFQKMLVEVQSGKIKWGCATEEALRLRYEHISEQYDETREYGYFSSNNEDEITINIGRYGDLLFNNGRHRLTIAKLLGIQTVPVLITVRHRKWVDFKCNILHYALLRNGRVYAPLLHPDLEWIPSNYGHKRYNLINSAVGPTDTGTTLLDIGCHWGYFCHRFEDQGLECTGVEQDAQHFYFLSKLRRAGLKCFQIENTSIFDHVRKGHTYYDIVLALAIFHHFLKTEDGFYQFQDMLKHLKMREMFFMPHHPDEPQMQDAYRNFTAREFIEFILDHSCLTQAHHIGFAEDVRPIYKLE